MQDLQVHVYACMPRNPSNETMRMWPQTLTTAQRPARTSSGLVGPGVVILCNDAESVMRTHKSVHICAAIIAFVRARGASIAMIVIAS
jgi:hypothetical protein